MINACRMKIWLFQKIYKKCSTSLAILEVQITTTMRYHFIPVRMVIIKNVKNNKCWRECGERDSYTAGGKVN
jgi:hypothetical protein